MLVAIDTTASTRRQQQVNAQVAYYLERHDSHDEGFSIVHRYARQGEALMNTYLPQGRLTLTTMLLRRCDKVLRRDPLHRLIVGHMEGDSLINGIRIDSNGFYAGQMNLRGEAWGHGYYRSADGTYFDGQWAHDQREGYGLSISPSHLHVGSWQRGYFQGEHAKHHRQRIYGIDISRYQHEKGHRHFPVNWSLLRVTHFGRRIRMSQVVDTVNYPVSFVYIKSTEGVTIENRYYAADDEHVRQLAIPVGAYHFFSTRTPAHEQARHFLSHAHLCQGDLPPMLDIEPSDKMIVDMGGPEALFSAIRQWLAIVERATRCRPLLYINQHFADTYLPYAPDLKTGYRFWVARYSEYKPYAQHDIWQLSGDGRVSGFQPDVDINVFNGYQKQWEQFLRSSTIP